MATIPVELRVPPITVEDHRAVKALSRGDASPAQQQLALAFITKGLAGAHDLPYVPGDPNAGAFLAGRAFVGHQIIKLVKRPIKEEKQ